MRAKTKMSPGSPEELFYQGRFREVVDLTELAKSNRSRPEFRIGALAFLGRVDDAELEFRMHFKSARPDDRIFAARFFLAVSNARLSRYARARELLGLNLRATRRTRSDLARFYAAQGFAFLRYQGCRYAHALRWSKVAWESAYAAGFLFGKILAADLGGQARVQTGLVSDGLASLEEALTLARRQGASGIASALEISLLCYRAQFGVERAPQALAAALSRLDPQDHYSRSNLALSLAQQRVLQGSLTAAENVLTEAAPSILSRGHPRQRALLQFRQASIEFLRGRKENSVQLLDQAAKHLDPSVDLAPRLQILGLKSKILRDEPRIGPRLRTEVQRLTLRTGSNIGARILEREQDPSIGHKKLFEDPLAKWVSLSRSPAPSFDDLSELDASGYWGLLRPMIETRIRTRRAVLFELIAGKAIVYDHGDIAVSAVAPAPLLRALALELRKGPRTKKEIVEALWGYRYHPLRHDPLIFALVSRLKLLIGGRPWVKSSPGGGGYSLAPGVDVVLCPPPFESVPTETSAPNFGGAEATLNVRQLQLLDRMRRGATPWISVKEYQAAFLTSKPTATRDLTDLKRRGLVRAAGNARATVYRLTPHP